MAFSYWVIEILVRLFVWFSLCIHKLRLTRYLVGVSCLLFAVSLNAEVLLSKELKLKAAYLVNFTKFIEWPNSTLSDQPPAVRICVEGSNDFYLFLLELVGSIQGDSNKFNLEVLTSDTAKECEMLYVTGGQKSIPKLLAHTVIITDTTDVYSADQAISFYIDKGKLRFEIDLEKMNNLGVSVSSELLKLARIKK